MVHLALPKPLPRSFFEPSPEVVARALVGKLLMRRVGARRPSAEGAGLRSGGDDDLLVGRIVETEAYWGEGDPAAHASAGRTARTAVLWGEPGHAYVYFIYGVHWCLNVSCEPAGQAGCVLFRALEPVAGLAAMRALRGAGARAKMGAAGSSAQAAAPRATPARQSSRAAMLASGPGRLCQAMAITGPALNGADMTSPASGLWLADDGEPAPRIAVTARVGITKAADRMARFVAAGSPFLSRQ